MGPIMQRGTEDVLGASHPCLVVTAERWWLFFSGYDGSRNGRRASVVGAVSPTGASWDRLGIVLEPEEDELAVSHPCVLDLSRTFYMFYASDDGRQVRVDLATSEDGASWKRRGTNPESLGARSRRAERPLTLRRQAERWLAPDVVLGPPAERYRARLPDLLCELRR
ncbi:MAG TPA: hypothetical protein VGS09_03510, partial [Actinomycetota bacterium]|nr:hypothetical protein [Actinomycetota bacterium]